MLWRWRRFKTWLGGVRHGATYRAALERIVGQGRHMSRADAGAWALDLAKNALNENEPYADTPTPALRDVMHAHTRWMAAARAELGE